MAEFDEQTQLEMLRPAHTFASGVRIETKLAAVMDAAADHGDGYRTDMVMYMEMKRVVVAALRLLENVLDHDIDRIIDLISLY